MATKVYDVVAITGEYTDGNGETKPRYLNCGVVLQTDKGFKLKLEAIPVESNGWFNLYEPKQQSQGQQAPQQQAPAPQPAQQQPAGGFGSNNPPF